MQAQTQSPLSAQPPSRLPLKETSFSLQQQQLHHHHYDHHDSVLHQPGADLSSYNDEQHWQMMDMDSDVSNGPNTYYSLEEAAAHAKAQMPIGARMGLPASVSRSSIASSTSYSSFEDEEPSLSRSLESTPSSAFPQTPARGDFGRRLPSNSAVYESPLSGTKEGTWQSQHGMNTAGNPADFSQKQQDQNTPVPCSPRFGLSSVLYRAQVTPARNSLGQSLGLSVKNKPQSGFSSISESPLSQSRRGSDDAAAQHPGFRVTPSNLAARRNLPPLAIRGNVKDMASNGTTMPHTPGGSVFKGARDGAANGGQTPVSPFIPPTPLVAPRNGQLSSASSPSSFNGQKRGSLPNIFAPLQSPMQRQGSLGPMSPLSRDFAVSLSVGSSQPSSSSTASGSSASTMLTTPDVSPLVAPTQLPDEPSAGRDPSSRHSSAESVKGPKRSKEVKDDDQSEGTLGATRPKLLKSRSTNRVSPYPSRDGTLGSPKTPRKNEAQLKMSATAKLLTPPAMEKSLSAPAPASAQTVSAEHLSDRQLHPDFAANYTIADELGSGGFGFVVSATRNADRRPVAVKFIWKTKVPTHGWVRDPKLGVIPLEAFVLRVVDHPSVVKFIDLFDDEDFFYLVMEMHGTPWHAPDAADEFKKETAGPVTADVTPTPVRNEGNAVNAAPLQSPMVTVFAPDGTDTTSQPNSQDTSDRVQDQPAKGLTPPRPAPMERRTSHDLFECIEQHTRFSEDVAAWVFAQIVEAVYYLAKLGICHRDIKDENCVIDSDWNVKLIDFGSAVISDPRKPAPYFNRFFGTTTFASSEILKGQQYRAPQAEVWSLGVLLSILLSGECPFSDPDAAVTGRISSRVRNSWSSEALNLLSGCVQTNPDKRATIAQVRDHPWVRRAWEVRGLRRPSAPRLFDGRQ